MLLALLVAALAILPWVAGRYPIYLVMQILILAVFSLGFNLLFGYTGLLSFGQAGFFAVGAYACAKILLVVPNLFLGIAGGVVLAGVAALLLGALSVRHTRIYFSMLTLAFGMMIYSIAWKWRDFTGGDDGLVGIPRAPLEIPGLLSISVSAIEHYYYVVFVSRFSRSRSCTGSCTRRSGLRSRRYATAKRAPHSPGSRCGSTGWWRSPSPASTRVSPGRCCRRSRTRSRRRSRTGARRPSPCSRRCSAAFTRSQDRSSGSVLFFVIKDVIVRFTEYWLIWFGVIVVALVMGFPEGVMSLFSRRRRRAAEPAPVSESRRPETPWSCLQSRM